MGSSKSKVHFFFHDTRFRLDDRKKLKRFIEFLFRKERHQLGSISFVFCTDDHLLGLNKEFLDHAYKTDVLTFPIHPDPVEAEVYMSIDRIRENSKSFHTHFTEELRRVMIHGSLHLCGYDDKFKRQQELMRHRENYYLKLFKGFT